jgi:hypothetical protein
VYHKLWEDFNGNFVLKKRLSHTSLLTSLILSSAQASVSGFILQIIQLCLHMIYKECQNIRRILGEHQDQIKVFDFNYVDFADEK